MKRDLQRNRLPGSRRVTPQLKETTVEPGELEQWKTRAEQAERTVNEYKADLHTETLKSSANNSRNHLSQLDLEEKRSRLQKRIDDLEGLPKLLKKEETKNEELAKRIGELEEDNRRLRKDVHGQVTNLSRSDQMRN